MRRDLAVRELCLIADACDAWVVDAQRIDEAAEKLISGGADGTALVGEFLALELAGLLEITPVVAALRIRETLDLRDRHPEIWAVVMAGGVEPWKAIKVAARCAAAGLSGEAARWVDHQLCLVLGALGWSRVLRSLEGLIVKADPALAAEQARQAHEDRWVFVGEHRSGGSQVFARVDTSAALALDATLDRLADALGATGSDEKAPQRRATALGLLADPAAALDLLAGAPAPTRAAVERATVVVHIAADTIGDAAGVTRIEDVGPLDTETLKAFLADSNVTVRPVIDLNTIPPVDAYEVPDRLRRMVQWRNPVEVFPFSTRRSRGLDLDHTEPYDWHAPPGAGQTRGDNLGPLSRRVHRAKTARVWQVDQTDPGVFVWTSPTGHRYEVSPEGTTPLGRRGRSPDHP